MAQTLREHAEADHRRLSEEKAELVAKLAAIDNELADIARYLGPTSRPATPRRAATNRVGRGSVQHAVYVALEEAYPSGMTLQQLKERLPDVRPQSISQVLQKFVKEDTVSWTGRGKPYVFIPRQQSAAAQ